MLYEVITRRTYECTPDPKLVVAVGECGANGGEFGVSYASCGAVANVIPVDGVVRGCPPTPSLRLHRLGPEYADVARTRRVSPQNLRNNFV